MKFLGRKEGESRSEASQLEIQKAIATHASLLAHQFPDRFFVSLVENDLHSLVAATTSFESDGKRFELTVEFANEQRGQKTVQEIWLRERDDSLMDRGESYRLDIERGLEINERFQRQLNLLNEITLSGDEARIAVFQTLFEAYDQEDPEGLAWYWETHAETTIESDRALTILKNATNFTYPLDHLSRPLVGPSLRDLWAWLKDQELQIGELLSSSE